MIVYLVTNKINGKRYVGQTCNSLEERRKQHLKTSSGCLALSRALSKYGSENFEFSILFENLNREQANEFEKEYVARYCTKSPNGYNLTGGGDGVPSPSAETRLRMSAAQTGKKQSEETVLKRAQKQIGRKRSPEAIKKLSESLRGNQNGLGHKKSAQVRKRLSEVNLGNKNAVGAVRTPEYLKALSERFKGRVFSEETKRKMSIAASKRIVSQETKDKHRDVTKRLGLRPPVLSKETLSLAGHISGHRRYHVARNIINPNCDLCKEINVSRQPNIDSTGP